MQILCRFWESKLKPFPLHSKCFMDWACCHGPQQEVFLRKASLPPCLLHSQPTPTANFNDFSDTWEELETYWQHLEHFLKIIPSVFKTPAVVFLLSLSPFCVFLRISFLNVRIPSPSQLRVFVTDFWSCLMATNPATLILSPLCLKFPPIVRQCNL